MDEKCPENLRSHDIPEKVVSDRMNVSSDVLDAHYDQRTEEEKMEQRRQFIKRM